MIENNYAASLNEIRSDIESLRGNSLLYQQKNFSARVEALDFIDFHIIGHIDALMPQISQPDELPLLRQDADKIKTELEHIDNQLFEELRAAIQSDAYKKKGFRSLVEDFTDLNLLPNGEEEIGYDNLDVFMNGLLPDRALPVPVQTLEAEMVYYQKTPARLVFEMVEQIRFSGEDVFFDIGSGLGQVAMLVNLLAGVKAIGIEFEPAFCSYASEVAAALNLPDVDFVNTDAREADYTNGTVFFMYTPFKGNMLLNVLDRLKQESTLRNITVITYGPCTPEVTLQGWLIPTGSIDGSIYKVAVFTSREPDSETMDARPGTVV
ncbi:class I SAM-dependent methyltransferase [Mucilaginibacter gilvus]|uniref:Histone-lysine N-methyltransferase, H3 lysine-79 specific n=1 Tax=Mucilaginibacter gilvus TaxID=2305909 RepID=A0A444MPJ3_9SPHI|nr:class I SAM-dependent methyltransferase [Mucilaginibacter gilvus]RWY52497.1 class I SAM-dependent methyltransferase [Mucilaginibacter gilvus]